MNYYQHRDQLFTEIAPGFSIAELDFDTKEISVATIKIEKVKVPRYPAAGFSCLNTDMLVTVLDGLILYGESGFVSKTFGKWDTIFIPRGTEYFWEIESDQVFLQAVNNPPFDPGNRKV